MQVLDCKAVTRLVVLAMAALAAAGCGNLPPAAGSNLRLDQAERSRKWNLGPADEADALAAMRGVAAGLASVEPPTAAPAEQGGMRWSDVHLAVLMACDEVEAAVFGTATNECGNERRYMLRTVEDWPGTLVVKRAASPRVYTATVTFGRFADEPKYQARGTALLAALARKMKAYGAKRQFRE